ncbi:MAG TPA: hypothetical protein VML50_02085, partial [Anaeromyxobacter sp.]|nr:hypothetical protein [Anaeromyxobacter sp.]
LVARGGRLAIVLPASLFADQASAPFREAFLGALRVEAIDWFPAEARLFEGVDQPVLLCLGRAPGPTAALSLARHGPDQGLLERRVLRLESLAAPLPLAVGGEQAALAAGLAREHPPLSSLEEDARTGLWLGRELDETRIGEALAPAGRGVPFLKGRHVFPWELRPDPPLFVDPSLRRIPATVRERRLAWRDVSRPNQRRRMHAALLPPGAVTGNSLGVAFFRRGGRDRLPVLLAVVNSLAFELQVRASLATAHVSQGVLRRCAVPAPAFGAPRIAGRIRAAAAARLRARGERPEVEVAVARAYGLRREAFAALLEAFPKLGAVEREALLADELWRGAGW